VPTAAGSGDQPERIDWGDNANAAAAGEIEAVAVAGDDQHGVRRDGCCDDVIVVRIGSHDTWHGDRRNRDSHGGMPGQGLLNGGVLQFEPGFQMISRQHRVQRRQQL
jgi:hypothetical protein